MTRSALVQREYRTTQQTLHFFTILATSLNQRSSVVNCGFEFVRMYLVA